MEKFKLGVIIPFYNSEKTLRRCLDSLNLKDNQSYILFYMINDHSNDNSSKIVNEYIKKFSNIKLISNTSDICGPSRARNIGIEEAIKECEYITFIDSDDYVDIDYFDKLLLIEKYNADIGCFSFYFSHKEKDKKYAYMPKNGIYNNEEPTKLILSGNKILSQSWGKIFKSALWEANRFPEKYTIYEDYAILYKLFFNSNKILIDSYCGYHYWLDNNSLLRNRITNQKIISCIKASLVPYLDNSLTSDLRNVSLNFSIPNYLMLLPRINKKELNINQKKELKEIKKILNKKIIKKYKPLSKKERIKRNIYLISISLYIYIYKYMILNEK